MSFLDLKFAEAEVETSGGKFAVRGLSLHDVSAIVSEHGTAARKVFDRAMAGQISKEDTASIGKILFEEAPELVIALIAVAAGHNSPEGLAQAKKLNLSEQIAALEKIAELTFATEGSGKKVIAAAIRCLQAITAALPKK